jgi:hypothetical protein
MYQGKLNSVISKMLSEESPKVSNLSDEDKAKFRFGLALLGSLVPENFFDIPRLVGDRHSKEGLFYTIEYFDSDQLWFYGNKRMLLVVYEIKDKVSSCPLSIELELLDEENHRIIVKYQDASNPFSRNMYQKEEGKYYTSIPKYKELTLSQYLNIDAYKLKEE